MNLLDTRPPFAGINGEIPPEFKTLSTPCYLMDEAVLQHNAEVLGAGEPGEKPYTVRLAGPTCLAGDVIGDYSFDAVPAVGGLLVFGDMAIYTTCKNNTFNGMALPAIAVMEEDGNCKVIREFGYEDFKGRLA